MELKTPPRARMTIKSMRWRTVMCVRFDVFFSRPKSARTVSMRVGGSTSTAKAVNAVEQV
jgi:hypothetical protein